MALAIGGVAIAALLLIGGGFLVVDALGDDDQKANIANAAQPANGAKKAADAFLAAARQGDCDRAYTFVKQPEQFPGQMDEKMFKEQVCSAVPNAEVETTVIDQSGRTAAVRTATDGEPHTYAVEKVRGEWKIDPLASPGAEQ